MDGVPTQSAGFSEVLASDWNTYVRDNFDSIKSGHIVCTSSTRPTGIQEGTMVYETDTNLIYVYTGSDWKQNNLTPVGMISPFAGSSSPEGWLICDGAAVSRTTYAVLFGLVGSTYGIGDGSTTFNVPDLRGRAPIGAGTGAGLTARSLAAAVGAETHTLTTAQLASHSHTINDNAGAHIHGVTDPGHAHAIGARPNSTTGATYNAATTATNAGDNGNVVRAATTNISIQSAGGHNHTIIANGSGHAHNNMQPSLVLNYIIKV